jgi:hypothetical protein
MSIEAMKQALEALDMELPTGSYLEVKDALRLAIEQAERQESYWQEEARRYAGNADFWREKAKRQPLTDEEIERACLPLGAAMLSFTEVARAIERAHGIGGGE